MVELAQVSRCLASLRISSCCRPGTNPHKVLLQRERPLAGGELRRPIVLQGAVSPSLWLCWAFVFFWCLVHPTDASNDASRAKAGALGAILQRPEPPAGDGLSDLLARVSPRSRWPAGHPAFSITDVLGKIVWQRAKRMERQSERGNGETQPPCPGFTAVFRRAQQLHVLP